MFVCTAGMSYIIIILNIISQMPQIDSAQTKSRSVAPLHLRRFGRLPPESTDLIQSGIQLLVQVRLIFI